MKRKLMISDIHGCLEQLNKLLEVAEYYPGEDQLILLGDYVDRGPRSRETVDRVMELVHDHGAIALKGNHDERLVEFIWNGGLEDKSKFFQYGGMETLRSYVPFGVGPDTECLVDDARMIIQRNYKEHLEFLQSLPLYYEDEKHICVHAGLNPQFRDWKEQPPRDFMYMKGEFHRSPNKTGKTVVFGHTRAAELHDSPDIWFSDGKIGIDGGCAYGMQLNGLVYQNDSYRSYVVGNFKQKT
ncbi:metallophosphoesterase family protein [Paenibacillus sp. GCM10012307]|uniref:Serine/threonine protein phosphatase n=1 Tax=Paenibacillus roseus TaxID=2798579 RepID=A0A934J9R7_9BACL|nr:metallophosphoesterase family protein [Paenibacillus roseus]MBJ6363052.1 serine/threonine protein phosphatase [Paenibacillus roseus]